MNLLDQAYADEQYRDLLRECGFVDIATLPSLGGIVDETQSNLFCLVAHKGQRTSGQ